MATSDVRTLESASTLNYMVNFRHQSHQRPLQASDFPPRLSKLSIDPHRKLQSPSFLAAPSHTQLMPNFTRAVGEIRRNLINCYKGNWNRPILALFGGQDVSLLLWTPLSKVGRLTTFQ